MYKAMYTGVCVCAWCNPPILIGATYTQAQKRRGKMMMAGFVRLWLSFYPSLGYILGHKSNVNFDATVRYTDLGDDATAISPHRRYTNEINQCSVLILLLSLPLHHFLRV